MTHDTGRTKIQKEAFNFPRFLCLSFSYLIKRLWGSDICKRLGQVILKHSKGHSTPVKITSNMHWCSQHWNNKIWIIWLIFFICILSSYWVRTQSTSAFCPWSKHHAAVSIKGKRPCIPTFITPSNQWLEPWGAAREIIFLSLWHSGS